MELKKNDIIQLEITDISGQGSGIGRYNGMAVFVPLTAVGDIINAHIVKVKKNYAFAIIENIIKPSANRTNIDCDVYTKCGGCVFRHISYDEELKIKQKRVSDALKRIGGISDYKFNDIVGCEFPDNYRNKSQIPIGCDKNGNITAGFFGNHSHRIIDCDCCRLHPPIFDEITAAVKKWAEQYKISPYDELTHSGILRHIYLRYAKYTDEIMVCIVATGSKIPRINELISKLTGSFPKIKSIIININREKTNVILGKECNTIYGKDYITDILCGLKFNISPLSFYQVNHDQAEKLYRIAAEYAGLTGREFLIDLYCGTGTIGLSMAHKAKKVLGIEIIPQAIKNAKTNANLNGILNAEFICSDASKAAENLCRENVQPDVILVDPPRKGCDAVVIESINKMNPERVVYVSCDPETLARDLKLFKEMSYKVMEVTPVDMFPRTAHVETVVQLVRKNPDTYIDITVDMDELDLTTSEAKATYDEIKDYIFDKHCVKVSSLYIAQIKQKHGIIERDCYNNSKEDNQKQPQCPPEKVKLIEEALRHFKMIS